MGRTKADFLVAEYLNKKSLSKLGYKFDPNSLDEVTAQIYLLIDSEINKLENQEMKQVSRRKR